MNYSSVILMCRPPGMNGPCLAPNCCQWQVVFPCPLRVNKKLQSLCLPQRVDLKEWDQRETSLLAWLRSLLWNSFPYMRTKISQTSVRDTNLAHYTHRGLGLSMVSKTQHSKSNSMNLRHVQCIHTVPGALVFVQVQYFLNASQLYQPPPPKILFVSHFYFLS